MDDSEYLFCKIYTMMRWWHKLRQYPNDLPGDTEKVHGKWGKGVRCSSRDSKPAPSERNSEKLPLEATRSIHWHSDFSCLMPNDFCP
jgi:hypothetical protein